MKVSRQFVLLFVLVSLATVADAATSSAPGDLSKLGSAAEEVKSFVADVKRLSPSEGTLLILQGGLLLLLGVKEGFLLFSGGILMDEIAEHPEIVEAKASPEQLTALDSIYSRCALVSTKARHAVHGLTGPVVNSCMKAVETVVGTQYKRVAAGTLLLGAVSLLTGWQSVAIAQLANIFGSNQETLIRKYMKLEGMPLLIRETDLPKLQAVPKQKKD